VPDDGSVSIDRQVDHKRLDKLRREQFQTQSPPIRRETASLLYFLDETPSSSSSSSRTQRAIRRCVSLSSCACTVTHVRDGACAKEVPLERDRKKEPERERERESACFCVGQYYTRVHFDGRTSRAPAERPRFLVRLSASVSLRNRTKPVSRHFGC